MNLVRSFFTQYNAQQYSKITWIITKLLWVYFMYNQLRTALKQVDYINTSQSLCKILPCSFFIQPELKIILSVLLFILCVLYVLEFRMLWVLFSLALVSLLIASISDSSGHFLRLSGFSLVLLAQLFAYALHHFKSNKKQLQKNRMQFPLQLIASLYALSFTSKIAMSGPLWFTHTEGFGAHVLKSWLYAYVTTLNEQLLSKGLYLYQLILDYPIIVALALLFALLLEGFAFLSLFHYKIAFFWGLGLAAMHLGIYLLMDISIQAVVLPMLLFMLNLPAVIVSLYLLLYQKFKKN